MKTPLKVSTVVYFGELWPPFVKAMLFQHILFQSSLLYPYRSIRRSEGLLFCSRNPTSLKITLDDFLHTFNHLFPSFFTSILFFFCIVLSAIILSSPAHLPSISFVFMSFGLLHLSVGVLLRLFLVLASFFFLSFLFFLFFSFFFLFVLVSSSLFSGCFNSIFMGCGLKSLWLHVRGGFAHFRQLAFRPL